MYGAAHGLSRKDLPQEKKPKTGITIASVSYEQIGGLLLLAAATETGLLTQLEQALPPAPDPTLAPPSLHAMNSTDKRGSERSLPRLKPDEN